MVTNARASGQSSRHTPCAWAGRAPDFFVVGAPKCGTTALDAYLRQHPEIFVPARKELHYFGSDLGFCKGARINRREYLSHFASARHELRVGETSVWYLYSQNAAAQIKRFCPQARIIIMLRNPLEMMASLHNQFLYECNEDLQDIAAALDAEPARKQGRRIPPGVYFPKGLYYREVAQFSQQVERQFETFGPENVHVILYDDFRRDTALAYARTCRFLGVDHEFRPDFPVLNASKEVRNRSFQFFLNNPAPAVLWLARRMIPTPLRHRLVDGLKRFNSRPAPRQAMGLDLRARLEDEFRDEIERLGRLLGRNLGHWCGNRLETVGERL